MKHIGNLRRWGRRDEGATAVEFTILLPVMLVTFAVIVEGARIYWNYQAAVSGVRDASRYLARITDNDVCAGGTLPTNPATIATNIINRSMGDGAANLFPPAVQLSTTTPVSAQRVCRDLTSQSLGIVPTWQVQATVEITLPLSILWSFFQSTPTGTMTSTITDQTRIYGL
ncbi:MAG: pilus assembly protein [Silicimonas sp.]|nr:pilus assembly protein [Silicimonas sp.]NND19750.1 pilus assembly protein [Silicimonas sp.]